ncbi:MAG: endonuclease III domain-containing protein [PVC group bacterium]|nr:endonuclease III domain-containing protein [PVC group bacterium]
MSKINNIFFKIFKRLHEVYGPQYWWPGQTRIEIIVGAILTQNTAWVNVEKAITNLEKSGVLSVNKLLDIKQDRLAVLIQPSGYYNVKAKRLNNFMRFLAKEYNSSLDNMFKETLPGLRDKLISVNGLGEETVDSILLYAGAKPVFVVDAYTRRIFCCQGLIDKDNTYQQIQQKFMTHLENDTELFNEYHALIVRLGKDVCRKKPKCNECPLLDLKM